MSPAGGVRSGFADAAGLRLHWVDWGGDGPAVAFIPGASQSGHLFGGMAEALADGHRVVGLAPRGHGLSDTPSRGYTVRHVVGDLVAMLDHLGIGRAAVVGHSLSGTLATWLAAEHPERVSHVVYLDAALDYAGWGALQRRNPVRPPPFSRAGPDPDAAERAWLEAHYYGFWSPHLQADWEARPPWDVVERRRTLLADLVDDAVRHPAPYARMRCPSLALVAVDSVETEFVWLDPADALNRFRAREYLRSVRGPWRRAALDRYLREAPHPRMAVEIPGHHFLFLTRRDRVAAEMRAFLAAPARAAAEG
jgi:pimeloyl-ACP methyl ester carboxylesterase